MAENKTIPNENDVRFFIGQVENDQRRKDAFTLLELMEEVTGMKPVMWGDSIIGFGQYHYQYESGREGEMFLVGFSPRKQNTALYINRSFDAFETLVKRLGKHKTAKSCMYINKTEDIDLSVLQEIVKLSIENHSGNPRK